MGTPRRNTKELPQMQELPQNAEKPPNQNIFKVIMSTLTQTIHTEELEFADKVNDIFVDSEYDSQQALNERFQDSMKKILQAVVVEVDALKWPEGAAGNYDLEAARNQVLATLKTTLIEAIGN